MNLLDGMGLIKVEDCVLCALPISMLFAGCIFIIFFNYNYIK